MNAKDFCSSCGRIPALGLGGKLSFYERCHCWCVLYSKNLHFHCCPKIWRIPRCSPRYSGLWYRAELCHKLHWSYGQVYWLKKIKEKTNKFLIRKWYVSVKLMLIIAFQLVSWSKWTSRTNAVVFCFYMFVFLERYVLQVTEQGLDFLVSFSPSVSVIFIQYSWNYFLSASKLPCPPPSFSEPPLPVYLSSELCLRTSFAQQKKPRLTTCRHKILSQKKTTCHMCEIKCESKKICSCLAPWPV